MHLIYSGGEVLYVAMQIEQNGAATYRQLAQRYPKFAPMLLELASDEQSHYDTFAKMHEVAGEAGMFHDAEEALTYLSRVADSFVFDRTADPLAPFAGVHSAADLFDVVIAMERKSIELYEAMLKVVRREQEAALVRAIIAEEENHVADLVNAKAGA